MVTVAEKFGVGTGTVVYVCDDMTDALYDVLDYIIRMPENVDELDAAIATFVEDGYTSMPGVFAAADCTLVR